MIFIYNRHCDPAFLRERQSVYSCGNFHSQQIASAFHRFKPSFRPFTMTGGIGNDDMCYLFALCEVAFMFTGNVEVPKLGIVASNIAGISGIPERT